jgi:transposase-like protein
VPFTSLGQIDVTVPRSREQGSPADVIGRYQRRSPEVDEMMVEAYVSGVSQRKMADVTEALMGERVGRSTVSRVAKRLDEAVQELRSAPIEGPHPYLYLDATFLDARWAKKVENVSALVAYAVGPDGHRRLLGISLGAEESEASWSELLAELVERGLSGAAGGPTGSRDAGRPTGRPSLAILRGRLDCRPPRSAGSTRAASRAGGGTDGRNALEGSEGCVRPL